MVPPYEPYYGSVNGELKGRQGHCEHSEAIPFAGIASSLRSQQ
jgi:hypothetical protein